MERDSHICRTCLERKAEWKTGGPLPLPQYYCSHLCQFVGIDVRFGRDLTFIPKAGKVVLEWWEHLVFWAVEVRKTAGKDVKSTKYKVLKDAMLDTVKKWDSMFPYEELGSLRDITLFLMDEIESSLRLERNWGTSDRNQQYIKLVNLYFGNHRIWLNEPDFTRKAKRFFQRMYACWTDLLLVEQLRIKGFANRGVKKRLAQCQKDVERFALDFDAFVERTKLTIGLKVGDYAKGLNWTHSVMELTILLMQRSQLGRLKESTHTKSGYYEAVEQQMENHANLWYLWAGKQTQYSKEQFIKLVHLLRDYTIAAQNKRAGEVLTYERQLIREKGLGMQRFIDPVTNAWNSWIETVGSYLGPAIPFQKTGKQVMNAAKTLGAAFDMKYNSS